MFAAKKMKGAHFWSEERSLRGKMGEDVEKYYQESNHSEAKECI